MGERGLQPPIIDPVVLAAGVGTGLLRGGVRAAAGEAAEEGAARQITLQTGHIMRHFVGTGLSEAEVTAGLRIAAQQAVRGASSTGSFWGRITFARSPR